MRVETIREGDMYETYIYTTHKSNHKLYYGCTRIENGTSVCTASSAVSETDALEKCKRKYYLQKLNAHVKEARERLDIKRLTQQKYKQLKQNYDEKN